MLSFICHVFLRKWQVLSFKQMQRLTPSYAIIYVNAQRGFYLLGNNFLIAGHDVDEMTRHEDVSTSNGKDFRILDNHMKAGEFFLELFCL